ncbi:alginate biosynthesis protein AlgA [Clostridium pasteurianum DSM 525 = ATCC 6013]|uniref:mannose-1-phosphate guanylyltransferase n=1 Tax=Clostridium pasteurianum DSM 525 = ATCC 6013 TaxID=1262449 RepID=A0A0H3J1Z8_CLOPA|nr:mannose-1-phosphate guanylyltransferase [Clostridium pasteurianum]AJA46752.1 alginate biosynthesis protein AlgA [Clostridium pasteurianum DSM 525 = ATCC 6013]AJA50740.1 alginate biosynthesis protein AlgA [Clostridium pasteurianum DSM 525 = ATCC 6013]AOZ74147.1 mannose-1-phosphate guanylyltransferase [Clostridium pasteurianum DSM 525 = ATCC 6013]AOZ77944.1 mannose-1-phosphate guanylyltransferase [Clostridium pasteurianum]ELP58638.1 mannose-1-phosphate guanylyltransferase [Clostridium pasteur
MLCALIMAGGKGERFWPLSTDEKPKQFLKLLGEETMIQMTVNRLKDLIPVERIFVVTGERYTKLVKEQLPELPQRNIIVEPMGKNTAPCIALSAFHIEKYYENATIAVLPSDHLIRNEEEFRNVIATADSFIEKHEDSIVTLGMKPDRAETGYGYIKCDKTDSIVKGLKIRNVEMFVEKPDEETAEEYLRDGNFLWNGGMFVWKAKNVLTLTEKYLKNTYDVLKEITCSLEEEYEEKLKTNYNLVDSVSIDYAIMEKAESIYVIPSEFGWDDVGTWYSVERYRDKDENNNVCVGNIININSKNNIIVGNNKPVIISGLDDIFVVESDDVILIGKKDDIKDIKDIKKTVL